jgi:tetratricopeptide (TPR) repeat protein
MTTLLLTMMLACAHHSPPIALEPVVITGSQELLDVVGMSNAEIIVAASERRLRGDTEGAMARLRLVIEQQPPPPEQADALYQLGLCHEREERFAEALTAYDRLVGTWPEAQVAQDGWFRRALCLEYLERHREARRSLDHVRTAEGLSLHDRLTLDLQRGITQVRSGRLRSGLKLIDRALVAAEGSDQVTYLRGKAHVTRARVLLDQASGLTLTGSQRRQQRTLEHRAAILAAAEQEVAAAAYLGEPEWILEGLLLLGDAYLDLHGALMSSDPPRSLSDEAALVYREEVAQRTQVLLIKSWNHYDAGVSKAGEWRYIGRPLPQLVSARDAIDLSTAGVETSSP